MPFLFGIFLFGDFAGRMPYIKVVVVFFKSYRVMKIRSAIFTFEIRSEILIGVFPVRLSYGHLAAFDAFTFK